MLDASFEIKEDSWKRIRCRIHIYLIYYIPFQSAFTCSKLTRETLEGVFIVNFEHISHFVLVFLLLTLSR